MSDPQQPRISEREVIHHGAKFDFVRVNLAPEGATPVWREAVRHPGAVCILPLVDGTEWEEGPRVVLIRNHRFAVGGDAGEVLWEIPAGTKEKGEPVETTAARELIEETGYRAGHLRPLLSFYTSPGMTDERMDAVLATDLTEVGQQLEEDERIEVHVLPSARVIEMLDAGEITDGKTALVLLYALRAGLLDGRERTR